MAKTYVINCKDVGVDCEFQAQATTIEEVIERCADHARANHGMIGFDRAMFAKMRACIHTVETQPSH